MTRLRAMFLALLTPLIATSLASAQVETVDRDGYTFVSQSGPLYVALVPPGSTERLDIVFMGDGYTIGDQDRFETAVRQFVEQLVSIDPFTASGCALNIWMVKLVSADSGIDEPASGIERNTALDARFAEPGESPMLITASYDRCIAAARASELPDYDLIYVLVNDVHSLDGAWADGSNNLICTSDLYPWGTVVAHEIAHKVGNLADEYRCSHCDGSFEGSGVYPFTTVLQPNLSKHYDRSSLPWADLILGSTALPTTPDAAWSGSEIGAWEGGGHYRTGVYRPAEYCIMDGVTNYVEPFCEVCRRVLSGELQRYCSP